VNAVQDALRGAPAFADCRARARFGEPILVPRALPRSFRVVVTDAYARRCAVTKERTLPVLEAAHISPTPTAASIASTTDIVARICTHCFDRGYVTVSPELRFEVSRKLKEDFENGPRLLRAARARAVAADGGGGETRPDTWRASEERWLE